MITLVQYVAYFHQILRAAYDSERGLVGIIRFRLLWRGWRFTLHF